VTQRSITPTAAPTPIPALAPVLRPDVFPVSSEFEAAVDVGARPPVGVGVKSMSSFLASKYA
jgi:hypothetical protein